MKGLRLLNTSIFKLIFAASYTNSRLTAESAFDQNKCAARGKSQFVGKLQKCCGNRICELAFNRRFLTVFFTRSNLARWPFQNAVRSRLVFYQAKNPFLLKHPKIMRHARTSMTHFQFRFTIEL